MNDGRWNSQLSLHYTALCPSCLSRHVCETFSAKSCTKPVNCICVQFLYRSCWDFYAFCAENLLIFPRNAPSLPYLPVMNTLGSPFLLLYPLSWDRHIPMLYLVMWRSCSKFAFVECEFQLQKFVEFECECHLIKFILSLGMQHTGLCQLSGCDSMLFASVNVISIQISTM